jgi:hypothetical protein
LICVITSGLLAAAGWRSYQALVAIQAAFYLLALLGLSGIRTIASSLPAKVAVYFTTTNAAALVAWIKYFAGVRQEIWAPSKRA